MASFRLESPECFNFSIPDGWSRWKCRFWQFRAASGLSDEDETKQVSTLLYCLGEGAEDYKYMRTEQRERMVCDIIGKSLDKAWFAHILLCKQSICFKLDTGAEVTAISHQQLGTKPLNKSS